MAGRPLTESDPCVLAVHCHQKHGLPVNCPSFLKKDLHVCLIWQQGHDLRICHDYWSDGSVCMLNACLYACCDFRGTLIWPNSMPLLLRCPSISQFTDKSKEG